MIQQEKSEDLVNAQIREFANHLDSDARLVLLKNMGAASLNGGKDFHNVYAEPIFTPVPTGDEPEPYNQWDDDPVKEAGLRERRYRATRRVTETHIAHSAYLAFLRAGGEKLRNELRFVESMNQQYGQYEPFVKVIQDNVEKLGDPELSALGDESPYLGRGYAAAAYVFEVDGRRLVAKISHEPKNVSMSHEEAMTFAVGNTIQGIQHMVAASPQGNVIITELLPGINTSKMTLADREEISEEHIERAILELIEMHAKGLKTDPKADNVMYDKVKGFSFLDYQLWGRREKPETPVGDIYYFSHRVGTRQSATTRTKDPSTADREEALRNRFFKVLTEKFPQFLEGTLEKEREHMIQKQAADVRHEAALARMSEIG